MCRLARLLQRNCDKAARANLPTGGSRRDDVSLHCLGAVCRAIPDVGEPAGCACGMPWLPGQSSCGRLREPVWLRPQCGRSPPALDSHVRAARQPTRAGGKGFRVTDGCGHATSETCPSPGARAPNLCRRSHDVDQHCRGRGRRRLAVDRGVAGRLALGLDAEESLPVLRHQDESRGNFLQALLPRALRTPQRPALERYSATLGLSV